MFPNFCQRKPNIKQTLIFKVCRTHQKRRGKIQTGENHVRQGLSKVFVFFTYSTTISQTWINRCHFSIVVAANKASGLCGYMPPLVKTNKKNFHERKSSQKNIFEIHKHMSSTTVRQRRINRCQSGVVVATNKIFSIENLHRWNLLKMKSSR